MVLFGKYMLLATNLVLIDANIFSLTWSILYV